MFSLSTSTSRYLKGRFGYCILSKLKQWDISYDQIIGYKVSATHTHTHTHTCARACTHAGAHIRYVDCSLCFNNRELPPPPPLPLSLYWHFLPVTNNYKQFVPRSDPTFCRIWFWYRQSSRNRKSLLSWPLYYRHAARNNLTYTPDRMMDPRKTLCSENLRQQSVRT